jgi:hypothetical protein
MKIKNLRGNLIYATLSPEIAQASGLKQSVVDDIRTARDDRNPTQPGAGEIEDDGGVAGGGGNVRIYTGAFVPINQAWIFSSETGVAFNGDIEYVPGESLGVDMSAGIKSMGAVAFDSITEAPLDGYLEFSDITLNNVYVVRTTDNHYVKMKITAHTPGEPGGSITFDYAYQQTVGVRDLST